MRRRQELLMMAAVHLSKERTITDSVSLAFAIEREVNRKLEQERKSDTRK